MPVSFRCPLCGEEHETSGLRMRCPNRKRAREAGGDVALTLSNLEAAARRTRWEMHYLRDVTAIGIPAPEREFRFHPTRQWRFDFAWPASLFAVEVEGLVPRFGRDGEERQGRHQTIQGAQGDLEKYAEAVLLGWRILRVSQKDVESGRARLWTERAFAAGLILAPAPVPAAARK